MPCHTYHLFHYTPPEDQPTTYSPQLWDSHTFFSRQSGLCTITLKDLVVVLWRVYQENTQYVIENQHQVEF